MSRPLCIAYKVGLHASLPCSLFWHDRVIHLHIFVSKSILYQTLPIIVIIIIHTRVCQPCLAEWRQV